MNSTRKRFSLISLIVFYMLVNDANCAPYEESTTQSSHPLTTMQYYVRRPTTKSYDYAEDYYEDAITKRSDPSIPSLKTQSFTPPEMILTLMRTALDVVRKMNSKKSSGNSTIIHRKHSNGTNLERIGSVINSTLNSNSSKARGMDHEIYYDDIHDHYFHHDHPPETTTTEKPKEPMKARYTDPWAGYYDFIITEGSFKFWSGFQLFTAALLLYSALAAIYFAKFNPIQPDYDTTYDDYFFGRSLEDNAPQPSPTSASPAPGWISSLAGMGSQAFHRIMDTINSAEKQFQ